MKNIAQPSSRLQKTARASRDCPSFRRRPEVSEHARLRASIHELLDPGLRRGDDVLPSRFSRQTESKEKQRGFTLVELVIVIVVLGILGAMGAEFISQAFKGFFDTDIRMEMYEEGKSALVRMEREIHIAVPNAVQAFDTGVKADSGNEIQFGVIDENTMATASGQYVESGNTITGLPASMLISIYNTQWCNFDFRPLDCLNTKSHIYTSDATGAIAITAIDTLSPYQRYYAVRPEAVRFRVFQDPTDITKKNLYRGTAQVNAGTALGTFGNDQLLARHVKQSNNLDYFTYEPGTSTRNSVVVIHFAIEGNNGETVNFHKEVQIRNVP